MDPRQLRGSSTPHEISGYGIEQQGHSVRGKTHLYSVVTGCPALVLVCSSSIGRLDYQRLLVSLRKRKPGAGHWLFKTGQLICNEGQSLPIPSCSTG